MKIELLGWSSVGLRCPDVEIQLTMHGKVAPVSLIQMPNGTGKTTTLDMLMATLNGVAEKWTPEKVRRRYDWLFEYDATTAPIGVPAVALG